MIPLTLEVAGVQQVNRKLGLAAAAVQDLRPVWEDVYDDFLDRESKVFDAQGQSGSKTREMGGGAWGEWEALNEEYAKRKAAEGYGSRILVRTGDLRSSLTSRNADAVFRADQRSVSMGTKVPYAWYHQTGKGVPKREPIRVSEAAARMWARMIQKFVLESGQFERENV